MNGVDTTQPGGQDPPVAEPDQAGVLASPNGDTSKEPASRPPESQAVFPVPPPKSVPIIRPDMSAAKRSRDADLKSAVAAAAAAAAANVAPGQRERAIAEAAAAVIARHQETSSSSNNTTDEGNAIGTGASQPAAAAAQAAPAATYEPPSWAGAPEGVPYTLEVLKNGTIVETRAVASKDHYTFGRSPTCDFVLEHPTSSRLHAVIQFQGDSREAFIFDNASTHGTFLNKARVKPRLHVPLRVGDTLRFGQSSRMYILGGPQELMPAEGLSRVQKAQLAQLEYANKMKERDKELARTQMAVAIHGEVSWGMGEDAEVDPSSLDSVDWRAYAAKNPLNERQQKLAEKIRSREYKIGNLRKECERIQAKEKAEGGLTSGQASTLVRNEQAIDKLQDEIDDLDEALNESVRDALSDKLKAKEKASDKKRRSGANESDEEWLQDSDSEDEFYDRTRSRGAAAGRKKARKQQQQQPVVESAESLYGKREALTEERNQLLQAIAEQEQVDAAAQPVAAAGGAGAAGAVSAEDASAAAMDVDHAEGRQQQQHAPAASEGQAENDRGAGHATASSAGQQGAAAPAPLAAELDTLDAFMTSMEQTTGKEKAQALRTQLAEVESQLERTQRLLRIADPDGWLQPSSKAAQAAKAAALKALEAERQKKAAAAAAAARKKAEQATAAFQEEYEEDEGQANPTPTPAPAQLQQQLQGQQAAGVGTGQAGTSGRPAVTIKANPRAVNLHRIEADIHKAGGLQLQKPAAGQLQKQQQAAAAVHGRAPGSTRQSNLQAAAAAAQLIAQFSGRDPAAAGATAGATAKGQQRRGPATASQGPASGTSEELEAAAAAKVAAELALLRDAKRRQEQLWQEEAAAAAEWVPPSDQQGDGRTRLNERYGY